MTDHTLRMTYPEKRYVREAEIRQWASDLWANEAPRYRCLACGTITVAVQHGRHAEVRPGEFLPEDPAHPCTCTATSEPLYDESEAHPPLGLEEAADYLEDLGVATFVRR
jgi:hypothetical protein